MKKKEWRSRGNYTCDTPEILALSGELGITPITSVLLFNRGLTDREKAEAFMDRSESSLYSPFLMKDMDRAADRILRAADCRENTVIYGDYDVDGVTSVSILYKYLTSLGMKLSYYVPSREKEGYGVNTEAIDGFRKQGTTLIITVDTGITAVAEAEYASGLGIDMVITDHHECQKELPKAYALVDPKRPDCPYPFTGLAGVGVAFKLICAIEMLRTPDADPAEVTKRMCREYIDLVAIGTVADVMPLTDENRVLVGLGIDGMRENTRTAVAMLLSESGSKAFDGGTGAGISSSTISYTIAPRINAAGRMESASLAVELFLSDDPVKARELAARLCDANLRRQEEENKIVGEVSERIGKSALTDHVIVLASDGWSSGIIGIVASRITERYGIPSILVTFDGDIGKGSGRSVPGIDLVEELAACSDLLIKYGGHSLAAGLAIERKNLVLFRERINADIAKLTAEKDLTPVIEYECEIAPTDITLRQTSEQQKLEPFGVSNPAPLFCMDHVTVSDVMELGGGKHTRLTVTKDGISHTALMFGTRRDSLDIVTGDRVNLLFSISENRFRGNVSVQLIVKDIALDCKDDLSEDRKIYDGIIKGGRFTREDDYLPSRDEIAQVYRYIRDRVGGYREDRISLRRTALDFSGRMSYIKIKLAAAVLISAGLISADSGDKSGDLYRFGINYVKSKTDIERDPLYVRLKGQCVKE